MDSVPTTRSQASRRLKVRKALLLKNLREERIENFFFVRLGPAE